MSNLYLKNAMQTLAGCAMLNKFLMCEDKNYSSTVTLEQIYNRITCINSRQVPTLAEMKSHIFVKCNLRWPLSSFQRCYFKQINVYANIH